MAAQTAGLGETFVAYLAYVVTFAGVRSHMGSKAARLIESTKWIRLNTKFQTCVKNRHLFWHILHEYGFSPVWIWNKKSENDWIIWVWIPYSEYRLNWRWFAQPSPLPEREPLDPRTEQKLYRMCRTCMASPPNVFLQNKATFKTAPFPR